MQSIALPVRYYTQWLERWCRDRNIPHVVVYALGNVSRQNPDQIQLLPDDYVRHGQMFEQIAAQQTMSEFAAELCSVQPMSGPTSQIFSMRYRYDTASLTRWERLKQHLTTRPWWSKFKYQLHQWRRKHVQANPSDGSDRTDDLWSSR